MPDTVLKTLETKYLADPDFTPKRVDTHSVAAGVLCQWVIAIGRYAAVVKSITSLRARVGEAEKEAVAAEEEHAHIEATIHEHSATIAELDAKLKLLEVQTKTLGKTLESREVRVHACLLMQGLWALCWLDACHAFRIHLFEPTLFLCPHQAKLKHAVESLAASRDQQRLWRRQRFHALRRSTNLAGDSLLAAACLVYFQRIPAHSWEELVAHWSARLLNMGLPVTEFFSLGDFMLSSESVRGAGCGGNRQQTETSKVARADPAWCFFFFFFFFFSACPLTWIDVLCRCGVQ